MTVYFQHVGERAGSRDFPRTIGERPNNLKNFSWEEIEVYLDHLDSYERKNIKQAISNSAIKGFQIWGIPAGAKSLIRQLTIGEKCGYEI